MSDPRHSTYRWQVHADNTPGRQTSSPRRDYCDLTLVSRKFFLLDMRLGGGAYPTGSGDVGAMRLKLTTMLSALALMAAGQWTLAFNPRRAGVDELRNLYELAM